VGDLGVDGRILLKCFRDWIHLAQNRVKWQVLVNTVMKFGIP